MTVRCLKCGQSYPNVPTRHFADGKTCDGTFEEGELRFMWVPKEASK